MEAHETATVTLATSLSVVKKALAELLKLPSMLFSRLDQMIDCISVDENAMRVPTFYAPATPGHGDLGMFMPMLIAAMLFGAIHCAGWNFPFPSHAELIIWRVSSLIIVVVPCTFVFLTAGKISTLIIFGLFIFGVVTYILARLTLLAEALIALRRLPPEAYAVVEWTALLPHI